MAILIALAAVPVAAQTQPAVLYHNYCSVCHGDKGDGRSRAAVALVPPPKDFTTPTARQELSRDRIVAAIKYGRPGTAMVAWGSQLSDRDIDQLADYVITHFVRRDTLGDPRGRQIYQRNCAVCHGDRGQGAVWAAANMTRPPRNFAAGPAPDRELMIAVVRDGRPGTAMSAFGTKLSNDDIATVVDFIRTAFVPASISGTSAHGGRESDTVSAPAGVDMKAQFPTGLKGDARRGSTLYLANCATCHGTRGDGAGPRAYFINPKPRSFVEVSARARYNRVALYAGVAEGRLGAEMPAWNKVLTDQQIADVAEYVFQSFISTAGTTAAR